VACPAAAGRSGAGLGRAPGGRPGVASSSLARPIFGGR